MGLAAVVKDLADVFGLSLMLSVALTCNGSGARK